MIGDKKYRTFSHAKTLLRYHLILSTKYRSKCLNHIRDSVISAFKEVEKHNDFKIFEIELDKNYVHLLVQFKPNYSITQVVHYIKQHTTYTIWRDNKEYLKKFYWSKKYILWTNGYFISTSEDIFDETLKNYIKNQR